MRLRLLLCAGAWCAIAAPTAAGAAGPPLPSWYSGKAGVVAPGGSERLVTRRAGQDTVIAALRRSDRRVVRTRRITGRWTIPAVTVEGATTGLSADGSTLLLGRPARNFPLTTTPLAVVDARRLSVQRRVTLPGFFTVDAISPDGRWALLIEYHGDNVLDYRVRALDTRTGRLAAKPIVDPREPDEQMGGLPMKRITSRDGRWAYTLYGGGEETFIHALDTVGMTAACIDLEMFSPDQELWRVIMRLSGDGRRLLVHDRGELAATVDTRTFAVREPGEASAPQEATPAARRAAFTTPTDGGGFPWPLLAAGVGGLCVLATATRRLRRASRRSADR